ncbi:MAG TPA: hypothetical protein VK195_09150 [Burkholderiaceae bacterium]|nr:hypothetical protein [Burkholderiaceae bacterium]
MDIKLNFVNRSEAGNTSEVVVFQKNQAMDMDALAVAWKIIRRCGRDCYHPLRYPQHYELAVRDSWGNFTPRLQAWPGQTFELSKGPAGGRQLRLVKRQDPSGGSGEIQVLNELRQGAVDICLYKAGFLLGRKTSVVPGQKALFRYRPTLWIGLASDLVQGSAFDSAVLPYEAQELSLLGLASADIVMSGGGAGPGASPYEFRLENVVAH